MRRERVELRRCQNPHCWRSFVAAILSERDCCDEACDRQRRAAEAKEERTHWRAASLPAEIVSGVAAASLQDVWRAPTTRGN